MIGGAALYGVVGWDVVGGGEGEHLIHRLVGPSVGAAPLLSVGAVRGSDIEVALYQPVEDADPYLVHLIVYRLDAVGQVGGQLRSQLVEEARGRRRPPLGRKT